MNERKLKSIRRILLYVGALLTGLWGIFTASVIRDISSLEKRNREIQQDMLDFMSARVESRLRQVENFITVTLVTDNDFSNLRYYSLNRAAALREVSQKLTSWSQVYSDFSGLFFYEEKTDTFLWKNRTDTSYYGNVASERRRRMPEVLKENCRAAGAQGSWSLVNVEDCWTLIYVYPFDGQFLGAYIAMDELMEAMIFEEDLPLCENVGIYGTGGEWLAGAEGYDLSEAPAGLFGRMRALLTGEPSDMPFVLAARMIRSREDIGRSLRRLILALAALLTGAGIFIFLHFLYRILVRPMEELKYCMQSFAEGDAEVRSRTDGGCEEVRLLENGFNRMAGMIYSLRIESYERQLQRDSIQLSYLQIQMNPHFFLNVLNVIHSLAVSEGSARIREVSMELIRHARYVLSQERVLVPLDEELKFMYNYLDIQRKRFPYALRVTSEGLTEEFLKAEVPPLLLQTFAENAVKYGLSGDGSLKLRLSFRGEGDKLCIVIADGGSGYPAGIAELLNRSGTVLTDERGEHTGLTNLLSRMRILFGENCGWHFGSSETGGGRTELWLPRKSNSAIKEVCFSKMKSLPS